MLKNPIELIEPNLLAVEGKDEVNFFKALVKYLDLQNVQILDIGGKFQFKHKLSAISKSPHFNNIISLGVIRDADTDSDSAFQSICSSLESVNLPVPEQQLEPIGNKPKVSVMILPGEGKPGMLEDLCLMSVLLDPSMVCVNEFCQCIQQTGLNLPKNISKAKVQVFLASREETGKRLGEAALAGYWPLDDEVFNQLKKFLRQIFS